MSYHNRGLFGIFFRSVFGLILFFLLLSPIVGAFCWPYTINTWLVFTGKLPAVVWWQGALMGVVPGFGQLALPLAVLTWIIMMFLK